MSFFVVFEGPEGSGKSTQARRLAGALREERWDVVQAREPGGTPIGERVRAVLLDPSSDTMLATTEALLYAAARAQLVGEVIGPALRRGAVVICDRYVDSSLAYQIGGRGLPPAAIAGLQELATGGVVPDLRILLDLPVAVGLARRYNAAGEVNRLDAEGHAFHERVAAYYRRLVAADPAAWLRLDAERSPDALAAAILAAVRARLAAVPRPAIVGGTA